MKKTIAAALLIASALATAPTPAAKAPTARPDPEQLHQRAAVVVEIDRRADVVTVQDCVGYLWEFIGCDEWERGDGCNVLLYDAANTPDDIRDDEIISVHYERFDLLPVID